MNRGSGLIKFRGVLLAAFLSLLMSGVCLARSELVEYGSPSSLAGFSLVHARWDNKASGIVVDRSVGGVSPGGLLRGVVESPVVKAHAPFDHAIVSWNATAPVGSYLTVYMKARVDGSWTKWYKIALWNRREQIWARTTYGRQGDSFVKVDTEVLKLRSLANAFKVRVMLESTDGITFPVLRYLAVNLDNSKLWKEDMPPVQSAWGKELDIPYLCQLSVKGGWDLCSPTSTAMVLGYWSKVLDRPDLAVGITEAARACFDDDWGSTGNWSFNVAYAGSFLGIRAYVTRFTSISQIEEWIAKDVPVIVALNYSRLNGGDNPNAGHLMVIRGFTKDGDVIFNDPWARIDKGEKLRKVFTRADLERGWLGPDGSYGTVYIIRPETG